MATGRKAWLFNHDKPGAQASANLFTLVTICRVNYVEPFAYLTYRFDRLTTTTTVEAIEALLPWNAKASLPQGPAATSPAPALP
jgi:transposase